ncbi:hypothetical protein ACFFWC_28075 [Plantactinospora siamensis]|uniref:Serine/threonine protein kinase n=1 Tax=Plantactinospora siamensis TaxID=555372 RepID=A0ABV6NQ57_9ACTN
MTAALGLALLGAVPAQAAPQGAPKDPNGGGSGNSCVPLAASPYASGSTIHFNGYTNCHSSLPYILKIGYGRDGQTKYSPQRTCYAGSGQQACGFDGVYATLTDNLSGSQRWCVSTWLQMTDASGHATYQWSIAQCVNH